MGNRIWLKVAAFRKKHPSPTLAQVHAAFIPPNVRRGDIEAPDFDAPVVREAVHVLEREVAMHENPKLRTRPAYPVLREYLKLESLTVGHRMTLHPTKGWRKEKVAVRFQ